MTTTKPHTHTHTHKTSFALKSAALFNPPIEDLMLQVMAETYLSIRDQHQKALARQKTKKRILPKRCLLGTASHLAHSNILMFECLIYAILGFSISFFFPKKWLESEGDWFWLYAQRKNMKAVNKMKLGNDLCLKGLQTLSIALDDRGEP